MLSFQGVKQNNTFLEQFEERQQKTHFLHFLHVGTFLGLFASEKKRPFLGMVTSNSPGKVRLWKWDKRDLFGMVKK